MVAGAGRMRFSFEWPTGCQSRQLAGRARNALVSGRLSVLTQGQAGKGKRCLILVQEN